MIRRLAHAALAAACVVTVATTAPVTATAAADHNTDPNYVVAFNDNIENWMADPFYDANKYEPCNDKHLVHLFDYIKGLPKVPDVFTVQQVRNNDQLERLKKELKKQFGYEYSGVIALPNPGPMGYKNDDNACKRALKDQQTNAVLWRTGRFSSEAVTRWRSAGKWKGTCANLYGTENHTQDRVANVAVRLVDNQPLANHRRIVVGTFHWPTSGDDGVGNTDNPYYWRGPDCADVNIAEANAEFAQLAKATATSPAASLRILGGDANTTVGSRGWWNTAYGYGFKDLVAEDCYRDKGKANCGDLPNTNSGRRIDFLLAKGLSGFGHVETIKTTSKYSDHLALTAYIKY